MATAKKTKVDKSLRVCALDTHIGEPLLIRANPDVESVKSFVAEHLRRYYKGEQGGPSGVPALKIESATYYESEASFWAGKGKQEEIDISDLDIATP